MIDIQFIPDDWERIDTCFGVFEEESLIRIGCSDLEYMRTLHDEGYALEAYKKYHNVHDLIIGTVEEAITHETIHIVLKRGFGIDVSYAFDNVDQQGEISDNRL